MGESRTFMIRCTPATADAIQRFFDLGVERARARRRLRDTPELRRGMLLQAIDDSAVSALHDLTRALEAVVRR